MNQALVQLQTRLGGSIHRPNEAAWDRYGSVASYYRDKFAASEWLETTVRGRQALVLVDLRRRVGPFGVDVADDEAAEWRTQQAVALVLPGVSLTSPLAPVDDPRGSYPHLFLVDHPAPRHAWSLASGAAPGLDAGPFRLVGCLQGVLYAVQDGPTLAVDAAARALDELARLAALPWRPPSPEALAAAEARALHDRRVGVRVLVAVSLLVIAALVALNLAMS